MGGTARKFYWIRLKDDFFDLETIDWLISQKNGCEYVVLYQKLCLLTANRDGEMSTKIGDMIVPYDANKIARDTKFSIDTVIVALELFKRIGLIYEQDNGVLKIPYVEQIVGSETDYARKKREYREKKLLEDEGSKPKALGEPKTNAQRQKAFRAKKSCEEIQHVPFIENHMNSHRYGGNYYIVMKRDKFKCSICGSIEKLCVHHIDGFDENKPENNAENKMLVMCRACHSQTHAGTPLPKDILESIDYYNDNVTDSVPEMSETYEETPSDKSIEIRDKSLDIKDNNKEKDKKSVDYMAIVNAYNETCVSLPSVRSLTEKRKRAIKARIKDYNIDDFIKVFEKAQESDFLSGRSGSWQATFDWLINENNMIKVLEGNYDNKHKANSNNPHSLNKDYDEGWDF